MDAAARDRLEPEQGAPVPDRRALLLGLGRTLLTVVGLLVLYGTLPLDGRFGARTLLALVAGLLIVGLLVGWQVRAILRSRHPAIRAVEAIALSLPLFLVLFAAAYVVLAGTDPDAFTEPLSRIDSVYFVVTVFATVGFGDISPVSDVARVLTSVQMVGDLVLIGLVLRVFLAAVDRRRQRPEADSDGLR
ncbi:MULTISPECIES: potassium channel family protein [unclassified Geodermatophilus]|uniref:potassium channel family protein n=1 Tax=unclassified Geodermatophilus TaxID=2637632 RepID=UPI003EECB381